MERRRKVVGSKRIGRIAEQSTFEVPANIAEPDVEEAEGNIAAVDATRLKTTPASQEVLTLM
jgi:hypothetical protein